MRSAAAPAIARSRSRGARRAKGSHATSIGPHIQVGARISAMPVVTAKSQTRAYDVIVVVSGAAGGQSAYTLCMDGAKVLMLEAGRKYSPETETPMFQTPDMAPLGGAGTPDKAFGFYDATVDGGWG